MTKAHQYCETFIMTGRNTSQPVSPLCFAGVGVLAVKRFTQSLVVISSVISPHPHTCVVGVHLRHDVQDLCLGEAQA